MKSIRSKLVTITPLIALTLGIFSSSALSQASVEEKRIDNAQKSIAGSIGVLDHHHQEFTRQWSGSSSYAQAKRLVDNRGDLLWQDAKKQIHKLANYDDRSLYWQRLKLSKVIRASKPNFAITPTQREALLARLEGASRGIYDLSYHQPADKKILLSGFDPFLLDRNISQSNPSGVAALVLDGLVIEHLGITAEINTFTVPVRYGDFDQGLIEQTLAPFYSLNNVDLIATISMGRSDFDLERFPGKRRSAEAPGNSNVYSGGSKANPVISKLQSQPLPGPEFVEFSLPVNAMIKAKGQYKINDNRQVSTLQKTYSATSLGQLEGQVAVAGSGGGYLSNEISYRSIRLRNELNSKIPTGHIHTPAIQQFEPESSQAIIAQITEMLKLSLSTL